MVLGLPAGGSCNLYGWGDEQVNPRRDAVSVDEPQQCDPNFPQVFCSRHSSQSEGSCTARLGSPLVCLGSLTVTGILLNDQSCSASGSNFLLNYHSLHRFQDWINEVTSDDYQENPRFTVFVMHYTNDISDAVQRCAGTIISDRHVLTTASCVSVQPSTQIAIESYVGSEKRLVSTRQVTIHPAYIPSQNTEANVAVVEVIKSF
jgi:secreted trypsin-like serine protease